MAWFGYVKEKWIKYIPWGVGWKMAAFIDRNVRLFPQGGSTIFHPLLPISGNGKFTSKQATLIG